ncbi:hypothetical protein P9D43_20900 [Neobacillus niacini]|uniref:hypothetical protein n=1 Tax=Neobacillus niacini TaxID=86668 RepID=UPI0007AB8D1B|nr:hypothetical protein [Neobacillus niacini]MEC1524465.1 hypothetical protein [Neobacillus niacini]
MRINVRITGSSKLRIGIYNVPFTSLEKSNETYSVSHQDNQYKYLINLKEKTYQYVESVLYRNSKKSSRNCSPVSIKKNEDQTFNIDIQIDGSFLINHKFDQGALLIEQNHAQVSYRLEINSFSSSLLGQIKQAHKKVKRKENKKQKVKQSTLDLIQKFEQMEFIHQSQTSVNQDSFLEEKGIYLTHPNAYKRCENCANYNGKKCSSYNLEVSDNHRCSRFYSYKTVYGGGFSPR